MDRVIDLITVIEDQVKDYAVPTYKAETYYVADEKRQIYMVVVVPHANYPLNLKAGITVMAHLDHQHIVIDQDITDRPLYEALIAAGVPREQIILAYAGETLPAEKDTAK